MLEAQDTLSDSLNSDIESQKIPIINRDYEKLNKTKQQVDHLVGILKKSQENDTQTEEALNYCVSISIIFIILLISIPLVIIDLYYAFSDHSCLKHSTIPVINLFIYLLLSGIYTGIEVIMDIAIIYFKIYKTYDIRKISSPIKLFTTIFGVIWTFIGAIMFWKSFEYRNSCNNVFYKYVFAQIIIKFVLTVINFKRIVNKR
jgi:hypothetical protein